MLPAGGNTWLWCRENMYLPNIRLPQNIIHDHLETIIIIIIIAYLCTKRLLSRYASAVLSWYEYKMRLAKSRLYFLTWRKDRNCAEQSEKKNRERDIRERKSNNFERKN